jgi:two-component system, NtrC family, response regulator AtoC
VPRERYRVTLPGLPYSPRTLVVDPERSATEAWARALGAAGAEIVWRPGLADVLDAIDDEDVDLVVADIERVGPESIAMARQVAFGRPGVRVVLSGPPELELSLAALRAAAFDYLVNPVSPADLAETLERAGRHRELREEVKRLRLALVEAAGFEELVGSSQPMRRLYDAMERAADTAASVLITGESGTGKELVARALHRRSRRRAGPFVAVNCAALPEPLLESELFGHRKGAFTDARSSRSGLLVKAAGGTVFLDEIGDMPLALQPKLLRALQERTVRPVGGDSEVLLDVRLIVATNRNLEDLVEARLFREDLFYRINVIHLDVPPLRERGTDVLLLAQHYLEHFALQSDKQVSGLARGAAEKLLAYAWPGNVRELQNCIERAVAMTRHTEIQVTDLAERIRSYRRSHVLVVSNEPSELLPLDEIERRYILRVLEAVGGNKKEAARILEVDRKTLYRKLERWGRG